MDVNSVQNLYSGGNNANIFGGGFKSTSLWRKEPSKESGGQHEEPGPTARDYVRRMTVSENLTEVKLIDKVLDVMA